jgi:hypothetical protein
MGGWRFWNVDDVGYEKSVTLGEIIDNPLME